jgi:hypothetical protein
MDSRPCWCSVDDAAFFEKLVCCIYQSDDCSADVDGEFFKEINHGDGLLTSLGM